MIAFGNREHGRRIAEAAGSSFNWSVDVVAARVEGDKLLGGIVFYGYTKASIRITLAGFQPNWANRDLLLVAFHYPFRQLECRNIFVQLDASNTKSLELAVNLGFKIVATVPDVYVAGDELILRMRRKECRFLDITPRSLKLGKGAE
jgi:RimJ/RimL family protein N-acetyltransferase